MTLLSARAAPFVVVRFSTAFAFAVVLAFALALAAVLALSFALALAVAAAFAFALAFALALVFAFAFALALALALAFAFALACVIHVHWICLSEVVHDPRLVRVQVGLDDRPQLVVVTPKLLRVHQQMVSQFLWGLTQHHADLHVIVQLCRGKVVVDVQLVFPRLPRFLKFAGLSLVPGCSTACSIANLRHAVFGAFSAADCLHASNPILSGTLCTSLKLCPMVSVTTKRTMCVTQLSDGHRLFFRSCRKVRHRLRLCVQQEHHAPLIHQGEIVLELETELKPGLLIVVVLDRFRSKLQDFCDVRRRHITAPLPCASFACSVTRSTTDGDSTQRHHDADKRAK